MLISAPRGALHFDGGKITSMVCLDYSRCRVNPSCVSAYAAIVDRVGERLHNGFHGVILMIDPKKLGGYGLLFCTMPDWMK
jgi:hypothetical protein